jgi:ribonuclease HI
MSVTLNLLSTLVGRASLVPPYGQCALPMAALARASSSWRARAFASEARAGIVWLSSAQREREACNEVIERLTALVSEHRRSPLGASELCRRVHDVATGAAALLLDNADIRDMRVNELRVQLTLIGLSSEGRKPELVERLLAARVDARRRTAEVPVAAAATLEMVAAEASKAAATTSAATAASLPQTLGRKLAALTAEARKGPQTGIFTDGSCTPNPGPGGWGIVAVRDGKVLWFDRGEERETTNNRMELSAIVFALRRIGEDEGGIIYTDSNLCVRTLTEWAPRWERNNWTRAQGEHIKNLDLVQEALTLARARPGVEFKWLRAHAGSTWNEYADILAGGRQ